MNNKKENDLIWENYYPRRYSGLQRREWGGGEPDPKRGRRERKWILLSYTYGTVYKDKDTDEYILVKNPTDALYQIPLEFDTKDEAINARETIKTEIVKTRPDLEDKIHLTCMQEL